MNIVVGLVLAAETVLLLACLSRQTHREWHRSITVLDDFEQDQETGAVTLLTHTACALCGELGAERHHHDVVSNGVAELRRAQGGGE